MDSVAKRLRPLATDFNMGSSTGCKVSEVENAVIEKQFSVVVPVYNEQEVLKTTYARITEVMKSLHEPYELIFVNDGSHDESEKYLEAFCKNDPSVRLVRFSRNFGHQVAISAGIDYARGAAVIIIDADLQDPPELIPTMIDKWREGYEVVYARRQKREGEKWFKQWSASKFYRTLRLMTDEKIPLDTGDFRLIDRSVCVVMQSLQERNRFVRGLVAWAGFRQTSVTYVREPRFAGTSKYPLRRMLRLASDAIISFSDKPLKWPLYIGGALVVGSLTYIVLGLIPRFVLNHSSGVALLIAVTAFLNGIVLISMGLMGQYVARIFDEVRGRPLYIANEYKGGIESKE